MKPTHLNASEIDLLLSIKSGYRDGPLSNTGARLQRLIDRHTSEILCSSRFPFAGFQGTCDRPVNHEMGTHRWTRPIDGWEMFWDDAK